MNCLDTQSVFMRMRRIVYDVYVHSESTLSLNSFLNIISINKETQLRIPFDWRFLTTKQEFALYYSGQVETTLIEVPEKLSSISYNSRPRSNDEVAFLCVHYFFWHDSLTPRGTIFESKRFKYTASYPDTTHIKLGYWVLAFTTASHLTPSLKF